MVQETWVHSQVTSYQTLLKWYLIPPCLTLSNIRYVSKIKWSNLRKGVAASPTPQCSSYWKRSLLVALNYGRQLYCTLQMIIFELIHSPAPISWYNFDILFTLNFKQPISSLSSFLTINFEWDQLIYKREMEKIKIKIWQFSFIFVLYKWIGR